jgi:hypothetical protein
LTSKDGLCWVGGTLWIRRRFWGKRRSRMGVNSQNNHESVHAVASTPRHPPKKTRKTGILPHPTLWQPDRAGPWTSNFSFGDRSGVVDGEVCGGRRRDSRDSGEAFPCLGRGVSRKLWRRSEIQASSLGLVPCARILKEPRQGHDRVIRRLYPRAVVIQTSRNGFIF